MGKLGALELDAPLVCLLLGRAGRKQRPQFGGPFGEPGLPLLHAHLADELGRLALVVQPPGQLAVVVEGELGGGFLHPEQLAALEVVAALPLLLALLVHDGHGDDDGAAVDPGLDVDAVMAEQPGVEGAVGPLLHQGELLRQRGGQRRQGTESQSQAEAQSDQGVAHSCPVMGPQAGLTLYQPGPQPLPVSVAQGDGLAGPVVKMDQGRLGRHGQLAVLPGLLPDREGAAADAAHSRPDRHLLAIEELPFELHRVARDDQMPVVHIQLGGKEAKQGITGRFKPDRRHRIVDVAEGVRLLKTGLDLHFQHGYRLLVVGPRTG